MRLSLGIKLKYVDFRLVSRRSYRVGSETVRGWQD